MPSAHPGVSSGVVDRALELDDAHSYSSTSQAQSIIWEIPLVDVLCSHLTVLTTPWRLVLGAYSSVRGKQAGAGERDSAQGGLGMGTLCLGCRTVGKNRICSGPMGVDILCLMERIRQYDHVYEHPLTTDVALL